MLSKTEVEVAGRFRKEVLEFLQKYHAYYKIKRPVWDSDISMIFYEYDTGDEVEITIWNINDDGENIHYDHEGRIIVKLAVFYDLMAAEEFDRVVQLCTEQERIKKEEFQRWIAGNRERDKQELKKKRLAYLQTILDSQQELAEEYETLRRELEG